MSHPDRKNGPARKRPDGDLDGLLAQAIAAHRAGRYEDAESGYHRVLRAILHHDRVVHLRADLAAQTGRWADADLTGWDADRGGPCSA